MLPRSKCKRVSVDGRWYQYVVAESGATQDGAVPLAITVQFDGSGGARLRVIGIEARRLPEADSKFYRGRSVYRSVEPRHIADLIRLAISRGWRPASSGPPFVMGVRNADVFDVDAPA